MTVAESIDGELVNPSSNHTGDSKDYANCYGSDHLEAGKMFEDGKELAKFIDKKLALKKDDTHCKRASVTTFGDFFEMHKRHSDIQEQINQFARNVKPIEFESYHEYFLINTFKKGISASGHVDIDGLRRRNTGVYYKKIKRSGYNATAESVNSSASSSGNPLSDDAEEEDDREDDDFYCNNDKARAPGNDDKLYTDLESNLGRARKGRTRAQHAAQVEQLNSESQEKLNIDEKIFTANEAPISGTISNNEVGNPRRRSSRLSQKTYETKEGSSSSDADADDDSYARIKDLFESLVPKVRDPYRRSDWILPSKFRYTPEKQMHTKPVFEKVKINELISSTRIRNVLSRYEGGVAGIRKRGWNSVS